MVDFLNSFGLDSSQWIILLICGALIGMAKTGLSGAGLMVVPLMAGAFGGKPSVGLVLPMLIVADVIAVNYFHRHADWKFIVKLMPWALLGVIIGLYYGNAIDDSQFKMVIGIMVIGGIALMVWNDFFRKSKTVLDYWWFAAVLGMLGGFTSMMGNAAGPVMSLYLLSMHLPKNNFIGTGAWFFFILNLIKVPLQAFIWKNIDYDSSLLSAMAIPAIVLGAIVGVKTVKLFPEKAFRIFILCSTLLSAFFLL